MEIRRKALYKKTCSLRSKRFQSSYCAKGSFLDEPREETLATQAKRFAVWTHEPVQANQLKNESRRKLKSLVAVIMTFQDSFL